LPLTRLYVEHCGRTYDEFERAMDRDRFMIAEEALEWAPVDRILQVAEDATDHVGAT
jgi:ATP-dependent Clp protease protease subunit